MVERADVESCNSFAHAVNQPQVQENFLPNPNHRPPILKKVKRGWKRNICCNSTGAVSLPDADLYTGVGFESFPHPRHSTLLNAPNSKLFEEWVFEASYIVAEILHRLQKCLTDCNNSSLIYLNRRSYVVHTHTLSFRAWLWLTEQIVPRLHCICANWRIFHIVAIRYVQKTRQKLKLPYMSRGKL